MRSATIRNLDRGVSPELYLWCGAVLLVASLFVVLVHGQFHLLAAIIIGSMLFAISRKDPATAIVLTFAYLFLMGDIRRILSTVAPQPAFDPLLLIGPGMAALLALPRFYHLKLHDSLSKGMLALLVIMALEIFNPSQGSLAVGLSGAFFYMVPVLWFWAGRSLANSAVVERLIYRMLLPLSALAALLGLYQTFVGFLPYQVAWVNSATKVLTSLYVGNTIRAFGFSVSGSEYATLLEFGVLASVAAYFAGRRALILIAPLSATSLLLASSRGYVVKTVFALAIVFVVRKGQPLKWRTLVGMAGLGVISLVGLSLIAARLAPADQPSTRHTTAAQNDVTHQLGGLAHPFDSHYSTAGTHAGMVTAALTSAITHPLGMGLGYTTFAAEKLETGSTNQGSSEVDLSDMFVALGMAGGLIYLFVAFHVVKDTLAYVRTTPRRIGLPVSALVVAAFGSWLVGGQYSTSSLLFFFFGAVVHQKNLCST